MSRILLASYNINSESVRIRILAWKYSQSPASGRWKITFVARTHVWCIFCYHTELELHDSSFIREYNETVLFNATSKKSVLNLISWLNYKCNLGSFEDDKLSGPFYHHRHHCLHPLSLGLPYWFPKSLLCTLYSSHCKI